MPYTFNPFTNNFDYYESAATTSGTTFSGSIGRVPIDNTASGIDVVFDTPMDDANYVLVIGMENSSDSPTSQYDMLITAKETTGFSVEFSGDTVSPNYVLNYFTGTVGEDDDGKRGTIAITSGTNQVLVSYTIPFSDNTYALTVSLENTTDGDRSIYGQIFNKQAGDFTYVLTDTVNTSNYTLNWMAGDVPVGDEGAAQSGRDSISNGASSVTVLFDDPFEDNTYSLVVSVGNDSDSPASIYAHTTSKDNEGFTTYLSGDAATGNYYIGWQAGTLEGAVLDDHAALNNLDYASSGHTGFQQANTDTVNFGDPTVSGTWRITVSGTDLVRQQYNGITWSTVPW